MKYIILATVTDRINPLEEGIADSRSTNRHLKSRGIEKIERPTFRYAGDGEALQVGKIT
jgi:hypothetical protein